VLDLFRGDTPERNFRLGGLVNRATVSNLGAQGGALAAVSVASLMVARAGGPTVLGEYALLRVLPWLFGVVFSCGLPTASAFFLAADHGKDRRLRPTLGSMALVGSALGSLAWLACAELFHDVFFKTMAVRLIAIMAVVVTTQLLTVTAKSCCQGNRDITGANLIIVAEELWFVFVYPLVLVGVGNRGVDSVILALIVSGTLAVFTGMWRLAREGFFGDWGVPSPRLAKQIAFYGARGQLGNMLWLTNLRFDFVLLGALAGPAVLGIYAVASKFAELMRLVPTAINYVLYPRFTNLGSAQATHEGRRLLPQATALTLVLTPFVAIIAYVGPALIYGSAFRGAVLPAEIIILGLSIEGAAAVSSAYLFGVGRPGLNSIGMGVGAIITVTLDLILIPRYGALGGAITSAITYASTTLTLTCIAYLVARRAHPDQFGNRQSSPGDVRLDTPIRRMIDALSAAVALLVVSPVLIVTAVAVKLTSRGPALYKQVRVGRSGHSFTMFKFRSMMSDTENAGPLITGTSDPRVTRVGALLRASKLDELPQLFNILKGDMTLIGPRPEVPRFLSWYDSEELGILRVRPGLTGPGQICYTGAHASERTRTDDPEQDYVEFQLHPKLHVELDYLRRRTFWDDMDILLRTIALVFCGAATEIGQKVRTWRVASAGVADRAPWLDDGEHVGAE
jgi:lipopolysaccharide/colanic/teichoic acid biosynthesis glycosyltransferase/O-antigen/teichoic acid export membrane protein